MKAGKGWSRAFAGVVSAACAASLCLAAEAPPLQGRPAIERFVPDLGTYPRQFAVEQGPSGIVHVGGADGLLTFDGTTWHSHDVGSEELVRSLAHDGRSRLYVGGYDTFGYFETPLVGEGRYVELVSRFGIDEPDFADIWQVEIMPEGVFFVGLNDVFRFDPASGRTGHWQHPGKFGALARIGDRLLLQYRGEGLREWHDGDFVPVPGSEGPGRQIFHLVPVGQDTGLAMDRDGGWIEIRPPGHAALEMPSGVPDSSYFASVLALGEGRLALGSVDGWLYFVDLAEGSVRSFRVAHDWISDLAWSPEGGIIAQTDLETLFVRWPSQWTAIGTDEGLNGAVMRVLPWQGRWLAITNGGVFATKPDDAGRFEPLPWTEFEAWDFLPLGDGSGLLADSYAVKHVDLEGVRATSEAITYPRRIVASRFHERRYYVGSEAGLGIFEFRDGELEPLLIPGADGEAIFTLVETAPDELLLGTQGSGVLRARIQADGTALVAERVDSGIDYGDAEYADLVEIDGSVHAVTENGFWRHVGGDFVRTDLDGLDALRVDDHFLEVRQAPDGSLWAFDFNRLFRHDGEAGWQRMDVDALFRGALTSIQFAPDGRVMVGASGSVLIHDPATPAARTTGFEGLLKPVLVTPGGEPAVRLEPDVVHSFPAGPFAIRFEYTLPGLSAREDVRYRARLSGYERGFTSWESTSKYTYYDLPPGEYRFEAQARGAHGRILDMQPFEFEVLPPWHRTAWARAGLWVGIAALLAAMVWLLLHVRTRRLEADRKRLAGKVRKRTEALVAANRKLRTMADRDGLTGIANRRAFDRRLEQDLVRCSESGDWLAVALIDLDRFKPFNDTHGHLAGDELLKRVAACLDKAFSDDVLVARFGGDEFAAVMRGRHLDEALRDCRRVRAICAETCPEIRLSIGLAVTIPGEETTVARMLDSADRQLYSVKRGENRGVAGVECD